MPQLPSPSHQAPKPSWLRQKIWEYKAHHAVDAGHMNQQVMRELRAKYIEKLHAEWLTRKTQPALRKNTPQVKKESTFSRPGEIIRTIDPKRTSIATTKEQAIRAKGEAQLRAGLKQNQPPQ